jgi:hypothetical protein
MENTRMTSNSSEASSEEETINCLVGYDWVYPSGTDPSGAWKFYSVGSFNSSTTMFGGMSTWGSWRVIKPNQVSIHYTRTTEGYLPDDQVLIIENCEQLSVGSTTYIKD